MSHSNSDIQISASNLHYLREYLGKFSLPELDELLDEIVKGSKEKKVARIVESKFNAGITYQQFSQLEVGHFVNTRKKGKWLGFSLVFQSSNALDCVKLRDSMTRELSAYYQHYVSIDMVEDAIWIRLSIDLLKNPLSSDVIASKVVFTSLFMQINLVHYPHSDFIFINGMTEKHKKFVLFSLQRAMNCLSIESMELECPDLASMKELVLERASQGRFKRFRSENKNPLDRSTELKVELAPNPLLKPMPNIVYENAMELEQKEQYIAHEFGAKEEQPTASLQFVKFVDYHCPLQDIQGKNTLVLSVKFEGKNVIAGLRECVQYSIVQPCLPPCLENLHSNSKNTYHWKDLNNKK
jgi:hypothetical protein